MLAELEKKAAQTIEENGRPGKDEKVLLAVSGGADSVALLHCFYALKKNGVINNEFLCAHINHQLRAEDAKADENFFVSLCEKLGVEVITRSVDVRSAACENKLSIETAARRLRIDALADIAKDRNCTAIATGHHKDDNAETILQRLSRGTGFRGLAGIWPVRDFAGISFVRPLLASTRDEIVEYLRQKGRNWCTDQTNADCKYRRNFIRHRLISELARDYSGSMVEDLNELSLAARKLYRIVCRCADNFGTKPFENCDGDITIDAGAFEGLHQEVAIEVLRRALTAAGGGQADISRGHYQKLLQLTETNISGMKLELPGGVTVSREYGRLIFSQTVKPEPHEQAESMQIAIPGHSKFAGHLIEASVVEASAEKPVNFKGGDSFTECFDLDRLSMPLKIRFRRPGDRFIPFGSIAEKKIGKFLTDQRVPRKTRQGALIVEDAEKIIWLWPVRMSDSARVTDKTVNILRIRITPPGW